MTPDLANDLVTLNISVDRGFGPRRARARRTRSVRPRCGLEGDRCHARARHEARPHRSPNARDASAGHLRPLRARGAGESSGSRSPWREPGPRWAGSPPASARRSIRPAATSTTCSRVGNRYWTSPLGGSSRVPTGRRTLSEVGAPRTRTLSCPEAPGPSRWKGSRCPALASRALADDGRSVCRARGRHRSPSSPHRGRSSACAVHERGAVPNPRSPRCSA